MSPARVQEQRRVTRHPPTTKGFVYYSHSGLGTNALLDTRSSIPASAIGLDALRLKRPATNDTNGYQHRTINGPWTSTRRGTELATPTTITPTSTFTLVSGWKPPPFALITSLTKSSKVSFASSTITHYSLERQWHSGNVLGSQPADCEPGVETPIDFSKSFKLSTV